MTLKEIYWAYIKKNNFSQGNEEKFLKKYFSSIKKGFYIDVGCHDPFRFSNTHYLYKKGWNGINIDANPNTINKFNHYRKRDININSLISNKESKMDYFFFNDPALNGIISESRKKLLLSKGYKILKTEKFKTETLNNILNKFNFKKIEFLNIDVEGHELEVLNSINFKNFEIELIMVESNHNKNQIIDYLYNYDFLLRLNIDRNLIFIKN